ARLFGHGRGLLAVLLRRPALRRSDTWGRFAPGQELSAGLRTVEGKTPRHRRPVDGGQRALGVGLCPVGRPDPAPAAPPASTPAPPLCGRCATRSRAPPWCCICPSGLTSRWTWAPTTRACTPTPGWLA